MEAREFAEGLRRVLGDRARTDVDNYLWGYLDALEDVCSGAFGPKRRQKQKRVPSEPKEDPFKDDKLWTKEVFEAWDDWKEMRKKKGRLLTIMGDTRAQNRLHSLTDSPPEAVEIINTATDCGWLRFHPLKESEGAQHSEAQKLRQEMLGDEPAP